MEQRLKDLRELAEFLEGKSGMPVQQWKVADEVEKLEEIIAFREELEESVVLGRHPLTKYFDLGVHMIEDDLRVYMYFKEEYESDVYDYLIGSFSGMNEWATEHVCHVYDFMTGNAAGNYALGTITLESLLKELSECRDAEKCKEMVTNILDYYHKDPYGKKVADATDNIMEMAEWGDQNDE